VLGSFCRIWALGRAAGGPLDAAVVRWQCRDAPDTCRASRSSLADSSMFVILRRMIRARRRTPGISRIDQPEKRTHGYFVRLARKGKILPRIFCGQDARRQTSGVASRPKALPATLAQARATDSTRLGTDAASQRRFGYHRGSEDRHNEIILDGPLESPSIRPQVEAVFGAEIRSQAGQSSGHPGAEGGASEHDRVAYRGALKSLVRNFRQEQINPGTPSPG